MSDARALYQAVIVDHDRHPRNRGPLATATHHATIDNPLCGDEVTLHVAVADGVVADVRFEARGCALARAAASMLTGVAQGLDATSARALVARFDQFVRASPADPDRGADLGDLAAFVGVRAFRSRQTCALLPFRALVTALDG